MNLDEAVKILKYHSKWIKGDIDCIDELSPFDILKAIEVAIKVMNKTNKHEKGKRAKWFISSFS